MSLEYYPSLQYFHVESKPELNPLEELDYINDQIAKVLNSGNEQAEDFFTQTKVIRVVVSQEYYNKFASYFKAGFKIFHDCNPTTNIQFSIGSTESHLTNTTA